MFTRCPHCNTSFPLTAAQLRAARGQARCGHCLAFFNSLDFLTDHLEDGTPATASQAGYDHPHDAEYAEEYANGAWAVPEAQADGDDFAIPELLRADMVVEEAQLDAQRRRWQFAGLSAVAVLALSLQYAWFKPDQLARMNPNSRPLLERMCALTGCAMQARRDPARVQILSRDVRIDTDDQSALLVTATVMNTASFVQPYPRLRFSLFDVNGRVIAARRFSPREYLGRADEPQEGMQSSRPVKISLNLVAPAEDAVSFEFRFL